jgi:Tol biopolymer transport system component
MNADGSDVIQLTNDNQVNCCPAWSPDGSKIAFVVQVPQDDTSEIWVMNADGSNPTNLTNKAGEDCCLAWSPDGSKIAFFSDRDASSSIYVMNADGSNPIRLTADTRVEHTPAWSPDGTRIAFFSGRHHDWVIYVMNPDGSNRIRLTNDHNDGRYPVWSPDGSKIAFIEYVKDYVYVMNADGSGLTYTTLRSSSLLSWLPTIATPSTLGPDCTSGWTRLTAGSQAKVSDENTTPNRVRSGPGTVNEIIAQLNPGTVVKILEGPVCTDRLVFWKVDSDLIPGGVGWTAEGDGTEYYLLPYQP